MNRNVFYRGVTIFSLLAVLFLGGASWWMQQRVEQEYKQDIQVSLQAIVDSAQESLNRWLNEHFSTVSYWSHQRAIEDLTLKLLVGDRDKKQLLGNPAQITLKNWFYGLREWHNYLGFCILSPEGLTLSSSRDVNIGIQSSIWQDQAFIKQVLNGAATVSKPLRLDIPLVNEAGGLVDNALTFFVGAPIREPNGKIIAILALRIDPDRDFKEVLSRGQVGESGDLYLIDKEARMISSSRFEEQLLHLGLLQKDMRELEVRDPGQNLFKISVELPYDRPLDMPVTAPEITPENWPLTHLASELVAGRSGFSITPYRDYRGVPVVGAWLWDDQLGFGIAAEQDASEAYKSLKQFLWTLNTFTVLAAFLLAGLSLIFFMAQHMLIKGEAALADSEEQMRALFNTSGDGIFLLDGNVFIDCNPRALSLFACQREDMIGIPTYRFFPEKQPDGSFSNEKCAQKFQAVLSGSAQFFDWRYRRLDFSEFDAEVSLTRVQLKEKTYVQAIVHDITARKQTEWAMKEAKEAAEEASAVKSRFLMNMSHQFRTPLHAILGFSQLIQNESVNESVQKWSEQLQVSGNNLLRLLNSILESIKMESGELKSQTQDFNLHEWLHRIDINYSEQARKKDLKFCLDKAESLPSYVNLDQVKLQMVIEALLDNALTYTPKGTIELIVGSQYLETEQPELTFKVKDTGPGINVEDRQRVFNSFEQVTMGASANSGAGLGLSLARGYVDLMGGDLKFCDSTEGCCLHFSVPFQLADKPQTLTGTDLPETQLSTEKPTLDLIEANAISLKNLSEAWLADFSKALEEVDQDQMLHLLSTADIPAAEQESLKEMVALFEIDKLYVLIEEALEPVHLRG